MISLLGSTRFQKEYKEFQEKISKVTNEELKRDLNNLLNKLVNEVRVLDSYHSELTASHQLPSSSTDTKDKILDIRKQIDKKLKNWDDANR